MENTTSVFNVTESGNITLIDEIGMRYIQFSYILIVIMLGTVGNLVVIFSIILDKKVHSGGNIFIINLAVADFLICAVPLPTIAATIITQKRALNPTSCQVVGFILNSCCMCSLFNMMLIAVNRYWAVVKSASYRRHFSKNIGFTMAGVAWIWALLMTLPTVLGWGKIAYDPKSMSCGWHDVASPSYAIFLTINAIFIPLAIIIFCYYRVFRKVHANGQWVRSLGQNRILSDRRNRTKRMSVPSAHSMRRERKLTITLITTVFVFFVCWTPYAISVLVNPHNVRPQAKKFLVWIALTNSCLNFIIYGMLNTSFKRSYKRLFRFLLSCKRSRNLASPTKRRRTNISNRTTV